ncbi:GNAT family N-acetyltransferase [Lentilactobacillus kribbianus]|uniref:GNAT family N-acetyltransferase n=1 Tax=Lentilactobacillus kribbianus TaxID=2729622 RepID=UPI001554A200
MKFSIRVIHPNDYAAVHELVALSYGQNDQATDRVATIERLRQWSDYNPRFEIVAEEVNTGRVIGHSQMVPVTVKGLTNQPFKLVSIISVSVLPEFQHHAIGQGLIKELESRAQLAGYPAVSAIDKGDFFYNDGYVAGENFNIQSTMPIDTYDNLIKPLFDGALFKKAGKIYYPDEFFGVKHHFN